MGLEIRGIGCSLLAGCLVVLLALALVLGPAEAASKKKEKKPAAPSDPPMTVVIMRSSAPGCEPNCPQWIAAEGRITEQTPALFTKVLKLAGKRRLPVIITSPGGAIDSAMAIGKMIRARKLDVAVGWTLASGCRPGDKACKLPKEQGNVYRGLVFSYHGYCASACPFILASGQRRLAAANSYVGVHQGIATQVMERLTYRIRYKIVNGKKKEVVRTVVGRKRMKDVTTTKLGKSYLKKLRDYLTSMGVDSRMVELMDKAPPSSIFRLETTELAALKLTTDGLDASTLVQPSLCKATPPADHCVLVEPPAQAAGTAKSKKDDGKKLEAIVANPMTVVVVRSLGSNCEPLCPQWIAAEGTITSETPALFREVLNKIGDQRLPVILDSDGGDFDAALEIGKLIRARGLEVAVASTEYIRCGPETPGCLAKSPASNIYKGFLLHYGDCSWSCIFVLASGARRLAGWMTPALIGDPESFVSNAAGLPIEQRIRNYFDLMGINQSLMDLMKSRAAHGPYNLLPKDLENTGLVNSIDRPESLVKPEKCKSSYLIGNCVAASS